VSAGANVERLRALFARPGLVRLVARLRERAERGAGSAYVLLADVDEEERREVAGLLGRAPGRGRSLRVPVREVEAVLARAGLAPDLRSALEAAGGALRDRGAERAAHEAAWEAAFDVDPTVPRAFATGPWLDELRASGLLKRLAGGDPGRARALLEDALAVLAKLPGHGQTLSTLAATALGDAHALDPGSPIATLVRRALRRSAGGDDADAERERELWAGAGIVVGGGITRTVLVLNLPAGGTAPTACMLRAAAGAGQPLWLTLRQLVQDRIAWPLAGVDVHVCENPAVVAEAADRLGPRAAALLCTGGQPGAAVHTLLAQLRAAGATLRYHGDFDWPGVRIANALIRRFDARPWHFDEAAYRAAARAGGMPLEGAAVEPAWDPGLGRAMRERGIAVPEERVLGVLLESLRTEPAAGER